MDNDNWVKKFMTLEVNGRRDPGRPKKTWEQVIASDTILEWLKQP